MANTAEQFAVSLSQCGLLPEAEVAEYVARARREGAVTAERLAEALIADQRLTRFQARRLVEGRSRELILGEYLLLDEIGAGAMGQVYLARHRRMDRSVALKKLRRDTDASGRDARRFQLEVKVAARLIHPNIVTAYDAGECDGAAYLAMEYVDGQSLAQRLRESGPIPAAQAVDWVLQAARGLAYAHAQGVVHRDVKPGNLLVDRAGVVKLLDMGLARLPSADAESLTEVGVAMGTLNYIAPEQADDARGAGPQADIYSLGCTLFTLLTGEPIFEGTTREKLAAHQTRPAPSLCDCAHAPAELNRVFQRMVAKRPEDRYTSMEQVIAALEGVLAAGDWSGHYGASSNLQGDFAERSTEEFSLAETSRGGDTSTDNIHTDDINRDTAQLGVQNRRWAPVAAIFATLVAVLLAVVAVGFAINRGRDDGEPAPQSPPKSSPSLTTGGGKDDVVKSIGETPAPASAPMPYTFDAAQARTFQERWAAQLGEPVEIRNSLNMRFVLIPPGATTSTPGRSSVQAPFYLSVYEVTQDEYQTVAGDNPSAHQPEQAGRLPVDSVLKSEAVTFCEKLSRRPEEEAAKRTYRLATTAEWRHACRAGSAAAYSFGDDHAQLGEFAYYLDNSDRRSHEVGQKLPNPFGLFDMHGNMAEWSADDRGALNQALGGTFDERWDRCGCNTSTVASPQARQRTIGFRIVCETPATRSLKIAD